MKEGFSIDTRLFVLAAVMLVLLGVFLLQARARIAMYELGGRPMTQKQKLRRYLLMTALWVVTAFAAFAFALARLKT